MKDKRNDLLVIIPAFNEEENICQVVTNLIEKYPQYDYVIINDGSMDRTSEIAHSLGYEIIDLPINLGLAGAFQTGMRYADRKKYKYAIQLDADGQHLPEYIAPMLEKIQEGYIDGEAWDSDTDYDLVIGSRFVTEKKPKTLRMLGSNLISLAIYLTTGRKISDPTSGMRLFNQEMIREFALNINYGPEPDTVSFLVKQGARVGEVQVHMEERMQGQSYLNWSRSIMYMVKMLLSILVIQNFRKRIVIENSTEEDDRK